MGFGNGAFQAARIAIDGVTIIENILTGKIQAPGVTIPSTPSTTAPSSYLAIPIANNQDVATPAPFQQMIQLNLSQYPQLQGIASDLSNIYFSSDEAGQNKLYSWRETPASLTSDVTWWVLLPNEIPAGGTITIYLQVSSSTTLDGVYTGEAPQLSSNYAEYDNGEKVFTNYWNFAGTSLPASFTSGVSSDGTLTVNNGLTLGTSITDNPSYAYIVSTSTYAPQIVEFYLLNIPTSRAFGGISTDWGFSSSTSPTPQGGGTDNNFEYLIGGAIYSASANYTYELWDNNTEVTSGGGTLNTGVYGTYINPLTLYYNYTVGLSATTTITSSNYLLLGISSTGSSAGIPSSETIQVSWLRTRAYPPNGVMPVLQAQITKATQSVIISSTNTWTEPQTFLVGPFVNINYAYVYAVSYLNYTVSVINTSTNTVVATITVGSHPSSVAITPNGDYAYVTNYYDGTVSVINTSTNTVVDTITLGAYPYGIAITPNGDYAYTANLYNGNVSVINTSTNTVVTTITVGTSPYGVAITPNGQYAYVVNFGSNNVSVINTSTNTVVATITVGSGPIAVAITPNGDYAYVANNVSNTVSVINTSTNTVVATITVGTNPIAVAITPNGLYAYVANDNSNNVSVINTSTNTVVDSISVGSGPSGIAITPNGDYAYVTNYESDTVSVINTSTNTVVDTITITTYLYGIAITPYFYTTTQIVPGPNGFQQNTSTPQTTLTGSTAGSITYSMPTAEGAYKKFVAYANGYENDTTTAQTISFPVAFVNTPYVVTSPSGLISSTTTTGITLTSGSTTTYTGWIIIEGY